MRSTTRFRQASAGTHWRLQGSAPAWFGSHTFTVLAVVPAVRAYRAPVRGLAPYLPGLRLGFLVGLVGSGLHVGLRCVNPEWFLSKTCFLSL